MSLDNNRMAKYKSPRSEGMASGTASALTDPLTLQYVLPIAAMALGSYGGFALANKLSDKRRARERKQRIKDNMNKLGKTNLELMQTVRKTAAQDISLGDVIGTSVNPFHSLDRTPAFNISGDAPGRGEKVMTKALMLGGTYGAAAFGLKYLLSAMERKREQQEGNKQIDTAVKAGMPIVSPDPSLRDAAQEEKQQSAGITSDLLEKEANERPGVLTRMFGEADPTKGTMSGSVKAALALIAVGSFGAGAVLTKDWADERDPNRARMKAAEKEAERMALQEKPPAIIGAIDPKIKAQLDAHIGSRAKPRAALESGGMGDQVIDPTDSLSKNVAVV